jgi:four helix bundle protein
MEKEKNLILDKSFNFSLQIISLYKQMVGGREYVISKQVLRSATSIGANIEEALAGHSKRDFVAKLIISHKEARETRYWLKLIEHGKLCDVSIVTHQKEVNDIINILSAIISTSKKNMGLSLKLFFFCFNLFLIFAPFKLVDGFHS